MTTKHTCPRRAENGMDRADSPFVGTGPNLDTYETGRGMGGQDRGCSYCGSMHPDDFMAAVRDGKEIGPTDKSYKFYVHEPLTDAERAERRQQQIGRYVGMGMTEQVATAETDKDSVFGTGADLGKFYSAHLSSEQQAEFLRLAEEKQVNWGYPGYPYSKIYLPNLPPAPESKP